MTRFFQRVKQVFQTMPCLAVLFSTVFATMLALPAQSQVIVKLATTTSTENSGLLKFLLPAFEAHSKIKVQVIAVGSGKALALAKNGDVDVVLVHARAAEDQFVAAGYGVNRRDVMFNDFVLVGPGSDAAGVKNEREILPALKRIVASNSKFISRGDNSGTDMMEKQYWNSIGEKPKQSAYLSAGLGMGEVLMMAAEMQAYTLSDRASFAAYRARTGLQIVLQGDAQMRNPYGIIAVNPEKHKGIQFEAAMQLINWLTSEIGRQKIAAFRIDGEQVFFTK
jgi:tungstate transport system substrate-binding protein